MSCLALFEAAGLELVAALRSDLIGPGWDDTAPRHEQLSQPPSVWQRSVKARTS